MKPKMKEVDKCQVTEGDGERGRRGEMSWQERRGLVGHVKRIWTWF